MCGIVGVVGNLPTKERTIEARDTLEHRGPDDCGLYFDSEKGVALGHRRLSILDLSEAGRQPFFSNDKRYVIVFNGEIYNYIEIKKELTGFYDFKTGTDTEVLLAAYIHWGKACLDKLNGMFALAIWDTKEKRLFCARDRVGIKPFFYFFDGKTFVFASEIKALLKLGVERTPDYGIIYDYLYYGIYNHSEDTFFKSIKILPAGHIIFWNQDTGLKIEKYWDLTEKKIDFTSWNPEQIRENFTKLLREAVMLQFRSDVPVGINLSSGLDSNSLFYFAHQVLRHDSHIFSMCLADDEYNECNLITSYLDDSIRKKWHPTLIDHSMIIPLIKQMVSAQDQPFGGVTTIAYNILNQEEKKAGITVLLEAQGVDEMLAGYRYYREENTKDLNNVKNDFDSINFSQDMTKLVDVSILNKEFTDNFIKRKMFFPAPFKSRLLNAQYRDLKYTKLPRVLRFNDLASMAHGRELRVPFLDHRLVEYCFWLPAEYKIRGEEQKVLLRDVMKGKMPQVINVKPKKSFGAIQTVWLRKYYKDYVYEFLNSRSLHNRGFWDPVCLHDKVNKFYAGEGENSFFLWQFINLELWFEEFVD